MGDGSLTIGPNGIVIDPSRIERRLGDSLNKAHEIINGERQDAYGNPENCFALIAEYWTTYLKSRPGGISAPITALDVDHMMMLFKIARCSGQKPARDNYIDIEGYAAIAADKLITEI